MVRLGWETNKGGWRYPWKLYIRSESLGRMFGRGKAVLSGGYGFQMGEAFANGFQRGYTYSEALVGVARGSSSCNELEISLR